MVGTTEGMMEWGWGRKRSMERRKKEKRRDGVGSDI